MSIIELHPGAVETIKATNPTSGASSVTLTSASFSLREYDASAIANHTEGNEAYVGNGEGFVQDIAMTYDGSLDQWSGLLPGSASVKAGKLYWLEVTLTGTSLAGFYRILAKGKN